MVEYLLAALLLAQQAPVPRPFPTPGTSQPARPSPAPPPERPAPAPAPAPESPQPAQKGLITSPTESALGAPIYPAAQYLQSFDAGKGQKFYMFGSTSSFTDIVNWYRNRLKQRGELVFDAPATHEFDIGRFREDTMAFPPGVTVKEFKSEISAGYPNPTPGAEPAWFTTLIQIVPSTEK